MDSVMKKSLIAVLGAVVMMAALQGCNTYEEGPYVSFRSKYYRLVNTWEVKNVFRGLVDVSAWYTDYELDLREDGRLTVSDRDELDSLVTQEGLWDLVNDNEDLQLIYTDPPVNPDRVTYEILKLKEDELWFQLETDSTVWEYRMIPVGSAE